MEALGTSAREVMSNEGREVGSGVERSVVQNVLGKVDVDVGIAGNRVIGTDGRVGDKDDKVVGSGRSDASTAGGTMMGQEASGAGGKESEVIDDYSKEGGEGDGVCSEVNEAYINRMLEDEYELMNDDGTEYMRWEGGEDNESDIDSPYVRYEGEISDADINKMVDSMKVDGSGEVDDDDINRMIDNMQVEDGDDQRSGRDTSTGGQCGAEGSRGRGDQRGADGSGGSSSARVSTTRNPRRARANAEGGIRKLSLCKGQNRRVQTLTRWTVESRSRMIAALKHSHGVT